MLLMSLILASSGWTLTDLDIPGSLLPMHAAVDDEGAFFVADPYRALLYRVSSDGEVIREFGGRGRGPGEFFSVLCIQFFEGKLYVFDQIKDEIHIFSRDGQFTKKLRVPHTAPNGWYHPLFKTKKGWLLLGDKVLQLMSDSFEDRQVFLGDLQADTDYRNRDRKRYNPSPEVFRIAFDQLEDRFVVYTPGDGMQLRVFSLSTLKLTRILQLPGELVPFDKDHGRKQLEEYIRKNKDRPWFQSGVTLDSPEYFTPIFMLGSLPTGEVEVILGNPLLPGERRRLYLDQDLNVTMESAHRKGKIFVMSTYQDRVLIRYPGKDGEQVLEKVARADYLDVGFTRPP